MFKRFTEKAIKVIMLSHEESRRLGHNFVCTEQILMGLIGEGTGIAAKVLTSMGLNLQETRLAVEKIIGRGSGFVAVEIPFTPGANRLLNLAQVESQQLRHNYISTEHLLLGLIQVDEGNAIKVLNHLGMDLTKVRTQVIQLLGEPFESSTASESSTTAQPDREIRRLLRSIETKTLTIEQTFSSLKEDIESLRDRLDGSEF